MKITKNKIFHAIRWFNTLAAIPISIMILRMAYQKEAYILFYLALAALVLSIGYIAIFLVKKCSKAVKKAKKIDYKWYELFGLTIAIFAGALLIFSIIWDFIRG